MTQGAFHLGASDLSPTAPLLGDAGSASRLASGEGISSRCSSYADSDDSAIPLLQNSAGGMLHDFVFQSWKSKGAEFSVPFGDEASFHVGCPVALPLETIQQGLQVCIEISSINLTPLLHHCLPSVDQWCPPTDVVRQGNEERFDSLCSPLTGPPSGCSMSASLPFPCSW